MLQLIHSCDNLVSFFKLKQELEESDVFSKKNLDSSLLEKYS